MVSAASNVRPNIADTIFSVDDMKKLFSSKGLSLDDLVTLSGNITSVNLHNKILITNLTTKLS